MPTVAPTTWRRAKCEMLLGAMMYAVYSGIYKLFCHFHVGLSFAMYSSSLPEATGEEVHRVRSRRDGMVARQTQALVCIETSRGGLSF